MIRKDVHAPITYDMTAYVSGSVTTATID